jgi:branched-chain amino acid transport system ATP-binding protein
MSDLLVIDNVHGGYGAADILTGASLRVSGPEIVVIIGPNGAGKSTLMKSIVGLVQIRGGSITALGEDITNRRTDLIAKAGLAYVPQERNVFPSLTVDENLDMGAYLKRPDAAHKDRIYSIFPQLKPRKTQRAGSLSGGERQMLAMGRALMIEPKLLLLDEPTAALAPKLVDETLDKIAEIKALGVGVLMVEQNAKQALGIADRAYVLVDGENRHEGTGAELLADREVARLFLGAKA